MSLKVFVRWHLFIFYIIGQVSHNPFLSSRNTVCIISQFLPSIVSIVLIVAMLVHTTVYQYTIIGAVDTIETFVGIFFYLSEAITGLTSICQPLYRYNQLIESFQSIELYLCKHFQFQINYNQFLRRYIAKIVTVIVMYGLLLIAKALWPDVNTNLLLETQYCLLRLFVLLPKLNVLFYVSFLKSFIKFSNRLLEYRNDKQSNVIGVNVNRWHCIRVIKHYKCLHFKLFMIGMQISDIFGWNLVTTMVVTFLEAAYMMYSMFFYDHRHNLWSTLSN